MERMAKGFWAGGFMAVFNGKDLLEFFTVSFPDPKKWFKERMDKYRQNRKKTILLLVLKIPICLYLLMQLRPFISDMPYALVLALTVLPFVMFNGLRSKAKNSLTLTLLVVAALYFCITKPLAIPPDPNNPRFNEKYFRFENYLYLHEAYIELEKLFPVGTSKEKVDHILIGYGQGKEWKRWKGQEQENSYTYFYRGRIGIFLIWEWHVNIDYDEKNTVEGIRVGSTGIPGL